MLHPGRVLGVLLGLAGFTFHAAATPVTVQEIGLDSYEVVQMTSSTLGTHWVYAGTLDLLVNGNATQGFCIDPFHWSITGPQQYNTEPLAAGPKDPVNGMGPVKATQIEQLWAQYYSANMSNQDAAGLQIAIWEIVGGSGFQLNSGNDYGASSMLAWVIDHPQAPAANLIAVTGRGQDYVIPNVPDAGETIVLLGMGLAGIALMRKQVLKKT
jgi:hypothetical protein